MSIFKTFREKYYLLRGQRFLMKEILKKRISIFRKLCFLVDRTMCNTAWDYVLFP